MSERWTRWPRLVALFGACAIGANAAARGAGVAILALETAVAVIVPLGLALSAPRDRAPSLAYRAAVVLLPLDAACGVFGWRAASGTSPAIACASVHVLVCAAVGIHGLGRLAARRAALGGPLRAGPLSELAIDVGLLLLPVGSVWLFASRANVGLLGFHEPVVLFTAAHFHFAGFAAPVVIGATGRLVAQRRPRAYAFAALVVCAGVPLTAVGIATNHTVEVLAALTLASGMLVAASIFALVASRSAAARSRPAAVLFAIAGAALVMTMSLATVFATTSSAGRGSSLDGAIALQTMIDVHGGGNAFGFAVSALVALTLLEREGR